MDKARISGDNFYKRVGSSRGRDLIGNSLNNFYLPSSKSENYSTIIQMLKSDLLTIQDMINSNSGDIKMYKILSKSPGLTKKLSEIEETKNINNFIDKITEQSANIDKISKIYGTKNNNECIQKLYLECGLNDLLIKKIYDYFTIIKLKINNDDSYQESLSKVIVIKEFIEKIKTKITNNNNTSNIKNLPSITKNNETEEFLKINTLNELLDLNLKNKKIGSHVVKLVNDYFNNLNVNIIKTINENDKEKNYFNEIKNLKGSEVEKFFLLKDIYDKIFKNINDNYELLLKKNNNNINFRDEINQMNEKHEKEIKDLKNKFEQEKEILKKAISENKVTISDIETIKNEKNKIEEMYKKQIENLNDEIKKFEKKIKDLENNKTLPKNNDDSNEINMNDFMKRHEEEYMKIQKEALKKLDKEIKDLSIKVNNLTEENNILKLDNSDIKKKLDAINKEFDEESYEQVLLQQFETMKKAFSKRIDELALKINNIEFDTRRKIYQLEEDLKESEHSKSLFLDQILILRKQLNK